MPGLEVAQALREVGDAEIRDEVGDLNRVEIRVDSDMGDLNDNESTTSEAHNQPSVQEQPLLPSPLAPGNNLVLPRAAGCVLLPAILALATHLAWGVLLLAKWEALEDLAEEQTGVPVRIC